MPASTRTLLLHAPHARALLIATTALLAFNDAAAQAYPSRAIHLETN